MLSQVKTFSLPQKARTYRSLADQFKRNGDVETSRAFYQKAEEFAKTPSQTINYLAHLAIFINPK
jgi:hypothetical protein